MPHKHNELAWLGGEVGESALGEGAGYGDVTSCQITMPWRQIGDDRFVEVIVDPNFAGDLIELARERPIWIVESGPTKPLIDAAWRDGAILNLCGIHRCSDIDGSDREQAVLEIVPTLHQHHNWSRPRYAGLIVRGVTLTPRLKSELAENGFQFSNVTPQGFTAAVNPDPDFNAWNYVNGGVRR